MGLFNFALFHLLGLIGIYIPKEVVTIFGQLIVLFVLVLCFVFLDCCAKAKKRQFLASRPPGKVYWASQQQGLMLIEPQMDLHGQSGVFAVKDILTVLMFFGAHDDFMLESGFLHDEVYIVERFAGAFDRAKANMVASIYVLPGSSFHMDPAGFGLKWITDIAVIPMLEIPIEDAKTHLLEFRDAGKLKIYFYPDRPKFIPSDDRDLIANALELIAQRGQPILDWLEREFANDLPHVIKAVREARG
jgi:hypothetical protein